MNWRRNLLRAVLGSVVVLGGMTLASVPASADRYSSCQRKIEKEERELDRQIRRHGYWSRQAQHERQELRNLRARCGGFYRDRDDRQYRDRDRDWR
jgi:hypothetical protein